MKDLTKGYPAKVIMLFAIPLLLGSVLQQLYNMADSMIVSTYVGTDALAAVGATGVISNLMIVLINGMTQGFAIPVANSFGAKDWKRMRRYVAGTVKLAMGSAVLITLFGYIFIESILKVLNTPDEIFQDAVAYIRIIFAGVIFTAIYNMCANVLRAVGDSRRPLYCLMIGVATNIGLDLLFVRGFGWGIRGAAFATVLSQALSSSLCATYLLIRYKELVPKKDEWKLEQGQYGNLVASGISMGMMGCIVHVGTVVLQSAINGLGTDIIAAHIAARRVLEILMTVVNTEGIAMTTYVSQNMGAGELNRVKQGVKQCLWIVTGISTLLIVICYLFGEPVLRWITHTDREIIIQSATSYVRIGVLFFYVLGPLFVLRCSLQGMGKKVVPVLASVLEMIIKIISAGLLVPAFQYMGVIFTEPISWIAMDVLLIWAYASKSTKNLLKEKGEKPSEVV